MEGDHLILRNWFMCLWLVQYLETQGGAPGQRWCAKGPYSLRPQIFLLRPSTHWVRPIHIIRVICFT